MLPTVQTQQTARARLLADSTGPGALVDYNGHPGDRR